MDATSGASTVEKGNAPCGHLCLIYENHWEWRATVVTFLESGLGQGEKCLYVTPARNVRRVRRRLREAGLDITPYEATGQFRFLHEGSAGEPEGGLGPDRLLGMLFQEAENAVREGYPALCLTREMMGGGQAYESLEDRLRWEAKLNRDFFPRFPCISLSQYDRRLFSADVIRGLLLVHPYLIRNHRVYRNGYYLAPEDVLSEERAKTQLQRWLDNMEVERVREDREEFLAEVLAHTPQPYFASDPDGRIVDCNPSFCSLTGYTREELLRMEAPADLKPRGWVNVEAMALKRLAVTGKPQRFEDRYRIQDGSCIPVDVMVHRIFDREGNVKSYCSFVRAVPDTDLPPGARSGYGPAVDGARDRSGGPPEAPRPRTPAPDRSPEALYSLLAESMREVVWTSDLALNLTYVSPSVRKLLGLEVEETIGLPITNRFTPSSRDRAEKVLETELSRVQSGEKNPGEPVRIELEFWHKNGARVWTESDIVIHLDPAGEPDGLVGVTRDISDRKMLREQLTETQRLEIVGTLAGRVAHEFNNILSAVIGYTQMALLDMQDGATAKSNMQGVLKAGERAKDLVRQILNFTRRTEPNPQPMRLSEVIRESLELLRASIPREIELRHDLRSDAYIVGDQNQIVQVILNLCRNAAHAMSTTGGGQLVLGLEDMEVTSIFQILTSRMKPGRYVKLTVSDQGHGIPAEVRERIFEPFFTTKENGEGSGIGLAVVSDIVRDHGGTIEVHSEVGAGTRFEIVLPAARAGV